MGISAEILFSNVGVMEQLKRSIVTDSSVTGYGNIWICEQLKRINTGWKVVGAEPKF
jgi:hypothetical protein